MVRSWWLLPVLLVTLVLVGAPAPGVDPIGLAWAQAPAPAPAPAQPTWGMILGATINAVGTMVVVKLLAHPRVIPALRDRVPALMPVLAGALGPAVAWAQDALTKLTGVPIALDTNAVLHVFTGASAVAIAQIFIQRKRQHAIRGIVGLDRLPADGAPL